MHLSGSLCESLAVDLSASLWLCGMSSSSFQSVCVALPRWLLCSFLTVAVGAVGIASAGDPMARRLWQAICEVSRAEFQKVYSRLGVTLREMGESAYNEMLPGVMKELKDKG